MHSSNVYPKFITNCKIPNALNELETKTIHKKLLNRSINQEFHNRKKLSDKHTENRKALAAIMSAVSFRVCVHHVVKNFSIVAQKKNFHQTRKFNALMILSVDAEFKLENTVRNISQIELNVDEKSLLKYGTKHGILKPFDEVNIQTKSELLLDNLIQAKIVDEQNEREVKQKLKKATNRYFATNKYNQRKNTKTLKNILDKNLRTCKFDKGNGVVVMTDEQYKEKMLAILNSDQFERLPLRSNALPPPLKDEETLEKLIDDIQKDTNSIILKDLVKNFYICGSQPAKLYGLPKVHKDNMPMRPVISTSGSATNKIAKLLDKLLKPLIPPRFECKDTFEFVEKMNNRSIQSNNEYMCSFDVKSLFTMIPLDETIAICTDIFSNYYGDTEKHHFKKLLQFAVTNLKFMYNDEWWIQKDGVSMGSPLAPTLANTFMHHLENKIDNFTGNHPTLYTRYVDDIFLIFNRQTDIEAFKEFMNNLHNNITFTVEQETNNTLPFLDVKITRINGQYTCSTYHKPTDTGLYTTPNSACDEKYRNNLINGLIHRIWKIGSNYEIIDKDIDKLMQTLQDNGYAKQKIERMIQRKIEKLYTNPPQAEDLESTTIVAKFPYGQNSAEFRKQIQKALSPFLQNTKLNIVFKTNTIGEHLNNKCRTPKSYQANLVYKFTCLGCDTHYIGESQRHLRTRVAEHGQNSRKSAIKDHCLNCQGRSSRPTIDEFTIVAKHFSGYQERKINEALRIKREQPAINIQAKDFGVETLKMFNQC